MLGGVLQAIHRMANLGGDTILEPTPEQEGLFAGQHPHMTAPAALSML